MNTRAIIAVVIVLASLGTLVFALNRGGGTSSSSPLAVGQQSGSSSEKPLSIDALSLLAPSAPVLEKVEGQCSGTKAITKLSWRTSPSALDYEAYRDEVPIGRVSGTSYEDTGLVDTARHCYTVRSRGQDPTFGSVLSEESNRKCVSSKDCSKFAGKPPVGGAPPPGATNTPTPTPTKKPTPTPTLTDSRCRSNTFTSDGKPVISVKTFNGSIQEALDCFKNPASGGGAVYIPAGTYRIPEKLRVYSNVIFFGAGIDQTIITLGGKSDSAMGNDSSSGQKNIIIRDLTLQGPGTRDGTCCHGLKLENLNTGFVVNVASDDWGLDGIYLGYKRVGGVLKGVDNVRISSCRANNNDRNGISITQGSNNVIDNCELQNNNLDPIKRASAIDLEPDSGGNTSSNRILDNRLFNNKGNGIGLGPNPNEPVPEGIVSNNAVCRNTTGNNDFAGIHAYKGNVFVDNSLQNNDGFEEADCFGLCATGPASTCEIPALLFTIPLAPPAVQGAVTRQVSSEEQAILESPFAKIADFFESFISLVQKLSGGAK